MISRRAIASATRTSASPTTTITFAVDDQRDCAEGVSMRRILHWPNDDQVVRQIGRPGAPYPRRRPPHPPVIPAKVEDTRSGSEGCGNPEPMEPGPPFPFRDAQRYSPGATGGLALARKEGRGTAD